MNLYDAFVEIGVRLNIYMELFKASCSIIEIK